MKLQLKRSNVLVSGAAKEPTAAQLDYGELAINYSSGDAAIFMKDSTNNVIRIGGVGNIADDGLTNVPTTTSPPTSPTPEAGNLWYNSEDGRLYIYYVDDNSSQWVDASPDTWQTTVIPDITNPSHQSGTLDDRYINTNGDTLTGALLLDNAAAVATPDLAFDGDLNTGIFSPGADSLAITTGGAQRVSVDSSGKVGIGVTTPLVKLDVVDSAAMSAIFRQSSGNQTSVYIEHDDSSGRIGTSYAAGGGTYKPLAFETSNTERMRIDSVGNVAIGPNTAGHGLLTLSQSASSAFNALVIQQGNTGSAVTDGLHIGIDSAVDAYITHKENRALVFGTANTERMRITSAGKLGVGYSAPPAALSVHATGTDATTGFFKSGVSNIYLQLGNSHNDQGYIGYEGDKFHLHPNNTANSLVVTPTGVGIGTTSPGELLEIKSASLPAIRLNQADTYYAPIVLGGNDLEIRGSSGNIEFYTGANNGASSAERMRIDSLGRLLHGTTASDLSSSHSFMTAGNFAVQYGGTTGTYLSVVPGAPNDIVTIKADARSGGYPALAIKTGNNERLRIDATGNVGIGTSSPNSGSKLHVHGSSATIQIQDSSNTNSIGRLINSAGSLYIQSQNNTSHGNILFRTSNGATAYERMRIDGAGNVGINNTSPDTKLDINGALFLRPTSETFPAENGVGLRLRSDTSHVQLQALQYTPSVVYYDIDYLGLQHIWHVNGTEKVRIDSAGNFGIGKSSLNSTFEIYHPTLPYIFLQNSTTGQGANDGFSIVEVGTDAFINNREAGNMLFYNNGSERMRIDSSGSLLVGRTSAYNASPGEVAAFQGDKHGVVIYQSANSNYTCLNLRNAYANNSGNNVSGNMITFSDQGGTERGKISMNGSSTSYITSSDYRLKENVVNIADGITRIKQLLPKRFNFIVDANTTVDGFLAHEAQAVVPEAVTGEKDGEEMQGIDQSKLVPLLTAALQEAIAKIETLETKVASLEANS